MKHFPSVLVRPARSFGSLSIFPLFHEHKSKVNYLVAAEAFALKTLHVEEIGDQGSVPQVLARNTGDQMILLIEGEQLIGANQDRIINTSVLVAHSTLTIPVTCVEQGRWDHKSRRFGPGHNHSPIKLRRSLKTSVTRSTKTGKTHRSHQQQLWKDVEKLNGDHGVESKTGAMKDAFMSRRERLNEYHRHLRYVNQAVGMAVGVGKVVVCADIFDKPEVCRHFWDRLVAAAAMDSMLEQIDDGGLPDVRDVRRFFCEAQSAPWEEAEAVGLGQEHRSDVGTMLSLDDTTIHCSVCLGA